MTSCSNCITNQTWLRHLLLSARIAVSTWNRPQLANAVALNLSAHLVDEALAASHRPVAVAGAVVVVVVEVLFAMVAQVAAPSSGRC